MPCAANLRRSYIPDMDHVCPLRSANVVNCPQPPRNLPGPPESVRTSLRSTTSPVRLSMTSEGTPATPLGKPTLFRPSLVGRAAVPPHWKNMNVYGSAAGTGLVPRNMVIQI